MPRCKAGSPPAYRHHTPTGQAVVTLDGRDHCLGADGTPASRQKYAALILDTTPESRARSVALTDLEQSVFWATAANRAVKYPRANGLRDSRKDFYASLKVPHRLSPPASPISTSVCRTAARRVRALSRPSRS